MQIFFLMPIFFEYRKNAKIFKLLSKLNFLFSNFNINFKPPYFSVSRVGKVLFGPLRNQHSLFCEYKCRNMNHVFIMNYDIISWKLNYFQYDFAE